MTITIEMMYADIESTIPINLIRPRRSHADGMTPPAALDVEFVVPVHTQSDANFWAGLLDDEPSGIFVPTYRRHPLGTLVAIALDLPGTPDLIVVNTVVRWTREPSDCSDVPPGIGLEFLALNRRARDVIARFAKRRAPLLYDVS